VIPRIQPTEKEAAIKGPVELYIHNRPKSPAAECARAIRTSLMFMSPDKPLRRILVTSGEPQEGKSTTATSLAVTLAQSNQRVLLVDTDMRRPRVHKIFKVPQTSGMTTLIAGEATVEETVRETGVTNLWVLPCGPLPPAKTGKTSRELLFRSRKQLSDLKANILGCVLNDLDLLNRAGYGYRYYHYRYGQYYGHDAEGASKASSTAGG
jgi:Mrp family chromosome partitioning ATPase